MSWSTSKVFGATVADVFNKSSAGIDCDADTFKAALFDNSITPSNTVTNSNTAYGAGVWASGGVSDASGWPAAGRALSSVTSSHSSGTWTFDASDLSSANSTTTLVDNYGCLIYDDTASTGVADQGLCFNYFGGAQQVTSGLYTLVFNAAGICSVAT